MFIYSFIFHFFSHQFQNINFLSHFSVSPTKLKLDTHMGKGLIYCVHQIQAARILFLYFSSFFLSLQLKLASTKSFQHTSDGYGRGYMSFAHSLLYFSSVLHKNMLWCAYKSADALSLLFHIPFVYEDLKFANLCKGE